MKPKKIYYETIALEHDLGKRLKEKYTDVEWIPIKNHNNIEVLRNKGNEDFVELKKYLIIGTRKTHKYVENHKVSDYLVPFTSSGCSAMCLYCYLVCNYNKCSYLRVYTNIDDILGKLIKKSNKMEKECTYEIGSNSDLILENTVTGNLPRVIEEFADAGHGYITFPTKFSMVENLLDLDHKGKTIFRMSINPQEIISNVEIGTSSLESRIEALNKMCDAGYKVGILIAPVILIENWEKIYIEMLDNLNEKLSKKARSEIFIEVIFMTYSYIHKAINEQAFPNAMKIYNKEMMTGRGRGKYCYKKEYRDYAEEVFRKEIKKRFNCTEIVYIV
ncbi:spore photoproduct lyase [Clostridioides mangenotii]|uniref:SPL family radical SAM protein n=1 Tax=Metaclostridioides mangenotii TaxID=1540 RepID=UPI001C0FFD08|nr:spore photoproduct lyase [Clostridioides mangenotii]MBU5306791.1 spore photoproduct lyase [Clostridioides mangenotii]